MIRVLCVAIVLCSTSCDAALVRIGVFRVSRPDTVVAYGAAGLRVGIGAARARDVDRRHSLRLSLRGSSLVVDIDGRAQSAQSVVVTGVGGCPVELRSERHRGSYRGKIRVSRVGHRMLIVNLVSTEDYVRGVLPNEMRSGWHSEALKAQAVVARTLTAQRAASHEHEGFDLCDTTHCQVYRGSLNQTPRTDAAVAATSGLVLTQRDQPIKAFYCSTCGGTTTGYMGQRRAGGGCMPSTVDSLDDKTACSQSPHYRWSCRVSSSEISKALASDKRTRARGALTGVSVASRDASGRASIVRIDGNRSISCDGYVFWNVVCRKLGWASLKSAAFTVSRSGDVFEFKGKGLGHGIGMCQWGAKRRAECGWDFRRILDFYYPGATLQRFRGSGK